MFIKIAISDYIGMNIKVINCHGKYGNFVNEKQIKNCHEKLKRKNFVAKNIGKRCCQGVVGKKNI